MIRNVFFSQKNIKNRKDIIKKEKKIISFPLKKLSKKLDINIVDRKTI
jgi:hypothetical protein